MAVFITRRANGKYNYLLNWYNPETGAMMGDWFRDMKEIFEYIGGWDAEVIMM